MPISRAKPIDQLYEDWAEYDLVIVPDAPLARALNRRLDRLISVRSRRHRDNSQRNGETPRKII